MVSETNEICYNNSPNNNISSMFLSNNNVNNNFDNRNNSSRNNSNRNNNRNNSSALPNFSSGANNSKSKNNINPHSSTKVLTLSDNIKKEAAAEIYNSNTAKSFPSWTDKFNKQKTWNFREILLHSSAVEMLFHHVAGKTPFPAPFYDCCFYFFRQILRDKDICYGKGQINMNHSMNNMKNFSNLNLIPLLIDALQESGNDAVRVLMWLKDYDEGYFTKLIIYYRNYII